MSEHDPLCEAAWNHDFTDEQPCGICVAIAKARKDENKKVRHLRDRIARLEDKANYWRDENVKLRAQLKEKS